MFKYALISTAHIHTKGYLKAMAQQDEWQFSILWDDYEERGKSFAVEYQIEYTSDLSKAITSDEVDGFVICIENYRHLEILKQLVPLKKPIFCEKPLVLSVNEGLELITILKEFQTPIINGYVLPWDGNFLAAKERLKDVKVIQARYRNSHGGAKNELFSNPFLKWHTQEKLAGGGAFLDLASHATHFLRTLCGPAEKGNAVMKNHSKIYPEVDDQGIGMIQFKNGSLGISESSWIFPGGWKGFEIQTEDFSIYEDLSSTVQFHQFKNDPQAIVPMLDKPTRIDRMTAFLNNKISLREIKEDLICSLDTVAIMEAFRKSQSTQKWETITSFSSEELFV